jgi:hypothetical protein
MARTSFQQLVEEGNMIEADLKKDASNAPKPASVTSSIFIADNITV